MDELDISIPSERLIGFTVPENNYFLVCGHDEVWKVVVGSSVCVMQTDYAPYEIAKQADFVGWGREDATPVFSSGQRTVYYNFDPSDPAVAVFFSDAEKAEKINFPTFSGDWFGASLSRDGGLLVLAEPYRISLYRTPQ
jgi:hypothetical protein